MAKISFKKANIHVYLVTGKFLKLFGNFRQLFCSKNSSSASVIRYEIWPIG